MSCIVALKIRFGVLASAMSNRFAVKDFVLLGAVLASLVMLLLAMYMVDRQWLMMSQIRETAREQADELRVLRGQVKSLDDKLDAAALRAVAVASNDAQSQRPAGEKLPAFRRAVEATKQADYAEGDWLVLAFGVGLKTISPLISQDKYASDVQSFVLETLLVRDPDSLTWHGQLASDWTVSDDGLTITFSLRPQARFSDGKPVRAQDVAFSYSFIMNEKIAAPRYRAYLNKIGEVVALDDSTVRFSFKEPYFNALNLAGTLPVLAEHFYGEYIDNPQAFNQSKGLLFGSGPFRLTDAKNWTPDAGLVELARNPRYWGPVVPSFERLSWKVIENDNARLTTFRNGEIDRYGARPREYHQLRDDEALTARTQRFEFMSPVAGYSYIGWNQRRGGKPTPFADVRVRQAMTYLTDRPGIIEDIMLGYAEPAVSPFSPRSKQHDRSIKTRPYDVNKGKALLAEAGYEDRDGDGVLESPDGVPLSFELTFFQDSEDSRRIVLYLKDTYARAGVQLKPKPSEWSVMLDAINKRTYDAITLGWSSGVETDVYQMFHSTQIEGGGDNFVHFENADFDALVDRARATVDEASRMPIWRQVERIFFEQQPYTSLMRRKTLAFMDKRIANVEVTNLGLNVDLVPVEVYVPQSMQIR